MLKKLAEYFFHTLSLLFLHHPSVYVSNKEGASQKDKSLFQKDLPPGVTGWEHWR